MRKLLQTLWLPLIFLLLPPQIEAQNGWVAYSIPSPGGGNFHFFDTNTGIILSQRKYLRTTNGMSSWATYITPDTSSTTSYGGFIFVNGQTGWMMGSSIAGPISFNFMHRTTDGGESFGPLVQVYAPNDIQFINSSIGYMASGEIPLFVTTGSIQKTTNDGYNWTSLMFDDYQNQDVSFINEQTGWVYGFFADDVGTFVHRIMRTTSGGNNWDLLFQDSANGTFNPYRGLQFFDENTGYMMINLTNNKGLGKSIDGGVTWNLIDTNVFTGNFIRNYFFLNKDTGWVTTGPTGKIFRTNDGGANWTMQLTTVSSVNGKIYFINEQTGWALANSTTILKTTTGGVTSIQTVSSEVPESFRLHQNYPNPFNPETKIKFEIPLTVRGQKSEVKLSVYDVSGKEVQTLVDSKLAPGVYEYSFDGAGLGSGVYFYTLKTNNFSETKRMVLVK